jgi:hypothetical protein
VAEKGNDAGILMNTMTKLMIITAATAFAMAANSKAQIGWTLNQCRKHWGRESSIEHHYLDESHTTSSTIYVFGFGSQIEKEVTFDQQGKVNDVYYSDWFADEELLKIPALLAREEGVTWETDPDKSVTSRHHYWIGKKDGVVVFHARYFTGHDREGTRWGESLHILPIEILLDTPPVSKIDTNWATANAARIEAEKKAKAAAGPTKEELRSAAHDAKIRGNNERALKAASNGQ